ncbi:S-layer family protein [Histomonas meleagridis]|uniref:S-layer family protein n=1 Tax=Histomonas meleagridis TaxID=135588 RepID=UPI003559EB23|nr:S-layer family protein [Histomonas meleagridis]KAH0801077.1 S-layer family protein [Histomonas meleagridis]
MFSCSAVILEKANFFNDTIVSRSTNIYVGPAKITDCTFKMCLNYDLKGGAIYSLSDLDIKHSLFFQNTGKKGGSIYCKGNITVIHSTFEQGYAKTGGAIYNEDSSVFDISQTDFAKLESINHGCFIKKSKCFASINYLNVSFTSAQSQNGGFCLDGGYGTIRNCDMKTVYAASKTCILLTGIENTKIEQCYFLLAVAESYGSILCVEKTNSSVDFLQCAIMGCSSGERLLNADEGSEIRVYSLCTTEQANLIAGNKVSFVGQSLFGRYCKNQLFDPNIKVGYYLNTLDGKTSDIKSDIKQGVIIGLLSVLPLMAGFFLAIFLMKQIKIWKNNRGQPLKFQ